MPVTGADGLRALKTARAALESVRTGRVVDIHGQVTIRLG